MKPVWEEEWGITVGVVERVVRAESLPGEEKWVIATGPADFVVRAEAGLVAKFADPERAKLAAQAPAMARWMEKIVNHSDGGTTVSREEMEEAQQILRKAGVIP